ncbi:MAG: hypothetical protein QM703_12480 [Gemmatales bacterium]
MPSSTLDADLACAIALGVVENSRMVTTIQQVNVLDSSGLVVPHKNWLRETDPLHQLTKQYLQAKAESQQSGVHQRPQAGWNMEAALKARDQANERAMLILIQARQLLEARGVLKRAKLEGLRILG